MTMDKKDLIKALHTSVQELQQGIAMHRCLVASFLDGQVDEKDLKPFLSMCPSKSREQALQDAITEAIEVLEQSRKAFKSKNLETLRKRLTQVLLETK